MVPFFKQLSSPQFLLHNSNTDFEDVYAMKSLAFSILPLLIHTKNYLRTKQQVVVLLFKNQALHKLNLLPLL